MPAVPHAEEVSDSPSDTGSPVASLQAEFGDVVDLHLCEGDWWEHQGEFAINPKVVNERARKLRKFIRDRPEKEIALVTHGFFAHFLTGDVDVEGNQTTPVSFLMIPFNLKLRLTRDLCTVVGRV